MLAIAHRGYSAAYPENTLPAFAQALAVGAALVETDLRLTADGAVVCSHDPTLERLAGRPDAIAALTAAELARVALPAGGAVPALEGVLRLVAARPGARILLDVKEDGEPMRAAVLTLLAATGMEGRCVYGVRDPARLAALRRAAPALPVLALGRGDAALETFLAAGVQAARLWEEEATPERVARVRAVPGTAVWVTAGLRSRGEPPGFITPERVARLRALGVDAVLLNDPTLVTGAPGHRPPAPAPEELRR